jgi:folate-dependent phosphoribosylglycinamide formyltransferase PurN
MNIAIITTDSYFSYKLISKLVEKRYKDVVSVIITPSRVKGKGVIGSVKHILKKTGWKNLFYKVIVSLCIYFAEFLYKLKIIKHCITPSNLAKKYNVDIFRSNDCNDNDTFEYLKQKNIDIIISINVYQRIKEHILNLPKISAVNNHFGLLPKYKGMSPYIWAMANGEKEIGLSVHHMVLEFDEGKVIKQEKLSIQKNDTAMGIYLRGCEIAKTMIFDAIIELEKKPDYGFDQKGEGSYFSMPTRECIEKFYNSGYKLWSFRDLLFVLKSNQDDKGK